MNLPKDFIIKYSKLLGSESDAFFSSFDNDVIKGFRVNPLKDVDNLNDNTLEQPIPYAKWGYYGKVSGKTVDHQSGLVYSQEPSAMLVGQVAAPVNKHRVLDLCAAPGGKTTALASFMDNHGLLVTNEIFRSRAKILAENVERFGPQNTIVLNESPQNLATKFKNYFDQIVVDAPCSGEGMFRKDPDAMQYWSLDYPKECADRQKEILTSAMKMLAPGGELIYSTCTFAPEEDEQIVAWLLKNYELKTVPIEKSNGMEDGRPEWADGNPELADTLRLFPHKFKGEGHFVAKLISTKSDEKTEKHLKNSGNSTINRDNLQLWENFTKDFFTKIPLDKSNLVVVKDKLYYQAEKINLTGIRYIKPGLELGTFKTKRFEPSLALTMAFPLRYFANQVVISEDEWRQYVHGDAIKVENTGKGWVVVVVNQTVVGPAKLVNGVLKNFYPKGLRMNF